MKTKINIVAIMTQNMNKAIAVMTNSSLKTLTQVLNYKIQINLKFNKNPLYQANTIQITLIHILSNLPQPESFSPAWAELKFNQMKNKINQVVSTPSIQPSKRKKT